jgi:phosphoribosylformimino-5-aminoimidazole carboxamide ribotide isomerase
MIIFPAIDIKDGKCVRLEQGKFHTVKVYGEDAAAMAEKWQRVGAEYLHVVDLDGAKEGVSKNINIIEDIVNFVDIPVQIGGGIRSLESIKKLIDIGVERVILGTIAFEDSEFVKRVVKDYGEKVIVSIDASNGFVATKGWIEVSDKSSLEFCKELEQIGVKTIVYTDIAKDGMMMGPNFEIYEKLQKYTNMNIIASGGISSLEDIKRIKEIGMYGCITGKALYSGAIKLEDALSL